MRPLLSVLGLAFLGPAALLAPSCGGGTTEEAGPETRIVLITLDTLRLDSFDGDKEHIGLTRTKRRADKRARVFTNYLSSTSTTQPTHATLFTGKHPWQHGVARNGLPLSQDFSTLTEELKAAGWWNGAVVASYPVHGSFGFDQGFDSFYDTFEKGSVTKWSGVKRGKKDEEFFNGADTITKRALETLDVARGKKQFFWFHYFDAHAPYGDTVQGTDGLKLNKILGRIEEAGGDHEGLLRNARQAYDEDVRFMDRQLDRLLDRLDRDAAELGIETHILIVSDHGEGFGESGSMGHGKRLTAEQIHVPCILFSPRAQPGREDTPVGTVDAYATILSLAGLPHESEGRDLTGTIEPARVVGMRRTFTKPYEEIRTDGLVHIVDGLQFFVADGNEVFTGNIEAVQEYDRTPYEGPRADEIKAIFDEFTQQFSQLPDIADVLDADAKAKLEALGYVDGDTVE